MDQDTYLILRITDVQPVPGTSLEPTDRDVTPAPGAGAVVEYQVDTATLDPRDERDLRRDPQVAAVALPMPLALIQPVAAATPAGDLGHMHGAAWGIVVTGALQSPYAGRGVTVAVLDTGIDAGHEAFRGIELIQRDFTGEGHGDQHGHGTHVAGTIFGQTVGGVRYSVAPGVRQALIGKVIGRENTATTKELVDAIQWAVDGGAHIINMSLGFDFPGLVRWWAANGLEVDLATARALAQYRDNVRLFDRLVEFQRSRAAYAQGALIVAAAGNESRRAVRPDYVIEVAPPAAADGIVAVAALGTAGSPHDALAVAPFSNIRADVAAPGVGVYSAQAGGGYTVMSGTSMASPHVAGVAALWAERQLQRSGMVNSTTLAAQLRGNARMEGLPEAHPRDVGDGLVTAPYT
ncbi:MAG TPA: S8 family serine peptidase [Roseiflexaceae bacterium]|nr:S8 family serine peptidase [Roseiflexaceae bacterium]